MRRARTWDWGRTRRYDGPSNDLGPSSQYQSCPDCIIATRGYDFREGQVGLPAFHPEECDRRMTRQRGKTPRDPRRRISSRHRRLPCLSQLRQAQYIVVGIAEPSDFGCSARYRPDTEFILRQAIIAVKGDPFAPQRFRGFRLVAQ
jgi:hypothetical protein